MDLQGKRVLVTGGSGFIGSHLVDKLLENENSVIVYDNFDDFYPNKEQNIEHNLQREDFSLVRSDILDYENLASAMTRVDVVFHKAAQCGVRYCIKNPKKAHDVNVSGTLNVLMAARQNNVKRLIFASSSGIFGVPHYAPMDEKHPTNPNSPYTATKLAGEKYCIAFYEVYGLDVVVLRYFSVYGPRGRPDQVIYAFTSKMSEDKRPVVFGNGEQTRDFTYVSDVVEATLLAAACEDASGEIFNIGFGREISINELFTKTAAKLGKTNKIKPVYEESYKGEFPRTLADNSKAQKVLGWKPRVEIDQGIDRFVDWCTNRKEKN